ncbi:hypothetical protein KIN20_029843, partial [Parelaphostrongylus tenuis]
PLRETFVGVGQADRMDGCWNGGRRDTCGTTWSNSLEEFAEAILGYGHGDDYD